MIICCTPLTAIRPAATGWTGLTDVRSGEQRSIRQEILQLADRLVPSPISSKATAALEAVVRQAKSPHSEAQQMRDFIAQRRFASGLVQKHCEIWAARQRGGYTRRRL